MRSALRQSRKGDRGSSLLELIIYFGILGFVLTAATLFSVEFITAKAKATAVSRVARSATFALEKMTFETNSSNTIDFDNSTLGSSPSVLTVSTSDVATDPTVFSVSGGRLYMQQGSDDPVPITPSGMVVEEFLLDDVSNRPRFRTVRARVVMSSSVEVEAVESFSSQVTMETTLRSWRNDGFSIPTP
jgi:type II secretory pathway pseudopilin PulG